MLALGGIIALAFIKVGLDQLPNLSGWWAKSAAADHIFFPTYFCVTFSAKADQKAMAGPES